MGGQRQQRQQRQHDVDGDVAKAEANLLATVLELTLVVAQTGTKVFPPFEAPALLKPFLQFTAKIPAPALRAARRVLDEDPLFRARVATVATEELVGSAGSLYVCRPDGWESAFMDAVVDAMGEASHEGANKNASRLAKKLLGAEAALFRAESELARVKAELAASQSLLAEERRSRLALAGELSALQASVSTHNDSESRARSETAKSTALAKQAAEERDAAVERAMVAENALSRRLSFDSSVDRALAAIDDLKAELRMSKEASTPVAVLGADASALSASPASSGGRATAVRPKVDRTTATRRKRIALPPGIFDDTVEAATALFRTTDVVVLVDAYNVAKWRWPTAGIGDLRERLLAMAGQISHRTGATIHLVFDGAHGGGKAKPVGSAKVRMFYTSEGVEADDVILDMAAKAPLSVPVVVVSNDMRVVDGALSLGANVVPNTAFAALSTST